MIICKQKKKKKKYWVYPLLQNRRTKGILKEFVVKDVRKYEPPFAPVIMTLYFQSAVGDSLKIIF